MKRATAVLLLLAAMPALGQNGGRRQLFNGKNLDGWKWVDNEGFRIEDGMVRTQSRKGILIYTGEKLGNETLRVVYKMTNDHGNSGIFIRIPEPPPTESYAIHHGIEVQIDDRDNDWHCTGTLYSMTKALARPSKPAGEWNTMDITMDGLRTIVRLNSVLVTDYDGVSPVPPKVKQSEPERGPRPATGYIALQNHDEEAIIYFKEISVAPLH